MTANMQPADYTLWTYLAYVVISVAMTVWVARTLHRNGRIFLVDSFHGNEKLADSVNHLLVVGFYLINVGSLRWPCDTGTSRADGRRRSSFSARRSGSCC